MSMLVACKLCAGLIDCSTYFFSATTSRVDPMFVTANSLIGSAMLRGLFNLRYITVSDLGCRPLESRSSSSCSTLTTTAVLSAIPCQGCKPPLTSLFYFCPPSIDLENAQAGIRCFKTSIEWLAVPRSLFRLSE